MGVELLENKIIPHIKTMDGRGPKKHALKLFAKMRSFWETLAKIPFLRLRPSPWPYEKLRPLVL